MLVENYNTPDTDWSTEPKQMKTPKLDAKLAGTPDPRVESRAAIGLYWTVGCLACGLVHSAASCWLDIEDRAKSQLRVPCESQAHVGIRIYTIGLVS